MGSHDPTMQSAALVLALALGVVSGDGLGHAHGRSHSAQRRSGRQEAPAVGYEQPPAEYGSGAAYQAGYDADAAASDADAALAMLQGSIPGVPGVPHLHGRWRWWARQVQLPLPQRNPLQPELL